MNKNKFIYNKIELDIGIRDIFNMAINTEIEPILFEYCTYEEYEFELNELLTYSDEDDLEISKLLIEDDDINEKKLLESNKFILEAILNTK
ncbi:TPA: hypothetical protein ACP6IR_001998 [Clostridioides difficile]|nr:hypothetical protein [Clostridioides difficile]HBH3656770.1 hypothetical protein [Clostridioides difficile]